MLFGEDSHVIKISSHSATIWFYAYSFASYPELLVSDLAIYFLLVP